jgi:transposase
MWMPAVTNSQSPEGLPLAYEMFPGNTADNTTLRGMLATIRRCYGAAERIWIMDRGIRAPSRITSFPPFSWADCRTAC